MTNSYTSCAWMSESRSVSRPTYLSHSTVQNIHSNFIYTYRLSSWKPRRDTERIRKCVPIDPSDLIVFFFLVGAKRSERFAPPCPFWSKWSGSGYDCHIKTENNMTVQYQVTGHHAALNRWSRYDLTQIVLIQRRIGKIPGPIRVHVSERRQGERGRERQWVSGQCQIEPVMQYWWEYAHDIWY